MVRLQRGQVGAEWSALARHSGWNMWPQKVLLARLILVRQMGQTSS